MKAQILAAALGLLAVSSPAAEPAVTLKDQKDKVSYSIGLDIGRTFKKQEIDVNTAAIVQGLKDGLGGGKTLLTDEEIMVVMQAFQVEMRAKAQAKAAGAAAEASKAGEKNKAAGVAFLADNKKKAGVKTTASGLQYKIVKEGTGKTPKASDSVTTHYRGTLIDGTEFDSSYKRNEPATFPVSGVIKGWTEALQLMKEGSEWELYIPADLAYGDRGAGQDIGPGSTLIFKIVLLKVEAAK